MEIVIGVILSIREVEKHVILIFLLIDETELPSPQSGPTPLELAVTLCLIVSMSVPAPIMQARINVLLGVTILALSVSLYLLEEGVGVVYV